jgi:hypothetical protein
MGQRSQGRAHVYYGAFQSLIAGHCVPTWQEHDADKASQSHAAHAECLKIHLFVAVVPV